MVADGDPETAAAAERAGARALTGPERLGKSQALNRGFEEADTPIVVISDANNRLVPGALAAAVEHFADPHVGAVAGEKIEDDGGGGESLYWRFESWLKQREDRLGTTIGLVGELAAIRPTAWRPIPADVAIDDLWTALDINEQGYRVAYEPRARALDPAAGSLSAQWERRTRIVSGALHVIVAPPPAAAAFGRAGGRRAVGAPSGPLHGRPPGPPRPRGAGASKVRSSALARVFLLAQPVRAAPVAGEQKRRRPRKRPKEHAAPGRHACSPPHRPGRGRSCSCRGSRSGAWCGTCVVTGRPCGRLWSDDWHRRAADDRRPAACACSAVSTSPQVWGAERSLLGLAPLLEERGIELTLASPPGRFAEAVDGSRPPPRGARPRRTASGCGRTAAGGPGAGAGR